MCCFHRCLSKYAVFLGVFAFSTQFSTNSSHQPSHQPPTSPTVFQLTPESPKYTFPGSSLFALKVGEVGVTAILMLVGLSPTFTNLFAGWCDSANHAAVPSGPLSAHGPDMTNALVPRVGRLVSVCEPGSAGSDPVRSRMPYRLGSWGSGGRSSYTPRSGVLGSSPWVRAGQERKRVLGHPGATVAFASGRGGFALRAWHTGWPMWRVCRSSAYTVALCPEVSHFARRTNPHPSRIVSDSLAGKTSGRVGWGCCGPLAMLSGSKVTRKPGQKAP